jgi:PHD/YefM family antitoxin component YafN of YafNO toxin-antitoxin module
VFFVRVTTAEFLKAYGTLADKALTEPVTITKDGRDRLVVVSAEEYERLRRRDQRAFRAEALSDADIALLEAATMAPEHGHLDEELGDWQP